MEKKLRQGVSALLTEALLLPFFWGEFSPQIQHHVPGSSVGGADGALGAVGGVGGGGAGGGGDGFAG